MYYDDDNMFCGFRMPRWNKPNATKLQKRRAKLQPPARRSGSVETEKQQLKEDDYSDMDAGACMLEDEFEAQLGNKERVDEELPSEALLNELYNVQVMDRNRNKIFVKALYKSKENQRHIIVFIRHFFCGMCYSYVKDLADRLPPEKLAAMNPPTKLSIIGCGDPILIPAYVNTTACPYDIYADPSRQLYTKLGFALNTDPAPVKPSYVERFAPSLLKNILTSAGLAARSGKTSGGLISQNGGEMIWIDGQLRFIHRMANSQDHTEVLNLQRLLKLQDFEMARKPASIMSTRSKRSQRSQKRDSWVRAAEKRMSAIFNSGMHDSIL